MKNQHKQPRRWEPHEIALGVLGVAALIVSPPLLIVALALALARSRWREATDWLAVASGVGWSYRGTVSTPTGRGYWRTAAAWASCASCCWATIDSVTRASSASCAPPGWDSSPGSTCASTG